ncbi:MAG: GrpB family protein [Sphingomonadales bacterium]
MQHVESPSLGPVEIVRYDPRWPEIYRAERDAILARCGSLILAIEHVGSTAIPGCAAKPVIDMMAAVRSLEDGPLIAARLCDHGYREHETDVDDRLLLLRHSGGDATGFHLHLVDPGRFAASHERLMRDHLLSDEAAVGAYGAFKRRLARAHREDREAYTRAKTAFIQQLVDQARAESGMPPIELWPE